MILLDVNVVLAAYRADHTHHGLVRPWFDELTASDESFTVPDVVWVGFVRLATSRRVWEVPSTLGEAFGFVRSVQEQPGYIGREAPDPRARLFEEMCISADASGDLVPDAYLASLAVEHDCELVSLDRDFARFASLRWRRPGDERPERRR